VDPYLGSGSDVSYMARIRLSDGAVLQSFTAPVFETGVSDSAATADPPRFGHSFSCPILTLSDAIPPDAEPPPPGSEDFCPCIPPTPTDTTPPGVPNDNEPPNIFPTIGQQLVCAGGGLVPTQADLVPSELWWGL
jgi:hypothetical protein